MPHLFQDNSGEVCIWLKGFKHIPPLEHSFHAILQLLCQVVRACYLQCGDGAKKILQNHNIHSLDKFSAMNDKNELLEKNK